MQIKTLLIETDSWWPNCPLKHGYGNGYIGLPPEHPWFNIDYDNIPCECHGGLTYAANHAPKQEPDGYWWIGFDTLHHMDDKYNCDKIYCENEISSMVKQALGAIKTK